jgi:hypothetical protein
MLGVHWGPGLYQVGVGRFSVRCESVVQLCFAYGHIKRYWTRIWTWSLLASCYYFSVPIRDWFRLGT